MSKEIRVQSTSNKAVFLNCLLCDETVENNDCDSDAFGTTPWVCPVCTRFAKLGHDILVKMPAGFHLTHAGLSGWRYGAVGALFPGDGKTPEDAINSWEKKDPNSLKEK